MKMIPCHFHLLLAGCISLFLSCIPAAAASRPNVVFILADDLGYSDLGCYGGEIATPQSRRARRRTACASRSFYNTARCWPIARRAAHRLLRAADPSRRAAGAGGGGGQGVRQSWARLLPDFLEAAGYRSYHCGKWHIDGEVLAGGFDRSLNVDKQGNYFSASGT